MSGSSIWSSLRAKFLWLIYKDVENTMAKLKTRYLDGLSDVEALHVMIKREHVHSTSLRNEENRLVRLFFAPKASAHLTHRYPDVLLMDATYKTNKHEMPLLHVVGVTGINNHFMVACCFTDAETTDSYLWAIRELERYLYRAPRVVVVDDEVALIKALASVWPPAESICVVGMQRNAFNELLRGWNATCGFAVSDSDVAAHWARTKYDLVESREHPWNYPQRDEHTNRCLLEVFVYIDKNKVPQRRRFASYAINDSRHFVNTSTSVAEGAHWTNIKSRLKSRSSLLDVFDRFKQSTEQRHNTISDGISRERVETLALPQSLFSPVLRQITRHVLRLVHKEYEKALHPTDISPCSGHYRQTLGLPCAHDLLDFIRVSKSVSVELFDRHWHKDALTTDANVIGVLAPFKVEHIRGRTPKNRRDQISKRYPSAFEAAIALFRAETRRCSQCGKTGHNKRTCFVREE